MDLTPAMDGEARRPGDHTCGSTPAGDTAQHCGGPAAWHILWTVDGENSLTCGPHMADALERWVFLGRHPISPDCTMPGALWSWDGNRCEVPGMAEISAPAEAAVRARPYDPYQDSWREDGCHPDCLDCRGYDPDDWDSVPERLIEDVPTRGLL